MNTATQSAPATTVSIPEILTANTYYWKPAGAASQRRRNEENRQDQVAKFFSANGFSVTRNGDSVNATGHNLEICFSYSETCGNVYKSLEIYRGGKKSNVTALRKVLGV